MGRNISDNLRCDNVSTAHDVQRTGAIVASPLTIAEVSEVIAMALSDAVSFDAIRAVHGLAPDAVKALMRRELSRGSYRAWRRRVRKFSDRREHYK